MIFQGLTVIRVFPLLRVTELDIAEKRVAVITEDQEDVSNIRMKGHRKDLAVIYGDP